MGSACTTNGSTVLYVVKKVDEFIYLYTNGSTISKTL